MHICCAPCFVAPYYSLKTEYEITAVWYNHNIHPATEYVKRRESVRDFVAREGIPYIEINNYGLIQFLDFSLKTRDSICPHCYHERLEAAALKAKEEKSDYFSTSLLCSMHQKHDLIKMVGYNIEQATQVPFWYQDLRDLWKKGIVLSKMQQMYRQKHCGCIFSEMERWQKLINDKV